MAYELRQHESKSVAMVRAGEQAHLYEWCRDNGYITIGWFGDPPTSMDGWSIGRLESEFRAAYPRDGEDGKTGSYRTRGSQTRGLANVADFLFNLPIGRRAMIASPSGGATVLFGEVTGAYEYHADWDVTPRAEPYCHYKSVRWIGEFRRSDLVEAAGLPWTDQQTIWWVEDLAAIRDLEAAAGRAELSTLGSPLCRRMGGPVGWCSASARPRCALIRPQPRRLLCSSLPIPAATSA